MHPAIGGGRLTGSDPQDDSRFGLIMCKEKGGRVLSPAAPLFRLRHADSPVGMIDYRALNRALSACLDRSLTKPGWSVKLSTSTVAGPL